MFGQWWFYRRADPSARLTRTRFQLTENNSTVSCVFIEGRNAKESLSAVTGFTIFVLLFGACSLRKQDDALTRTFEHDVRKISLSDFRDIQ